MKLKLKFKNHSRVFILLFLSLSLICGFTSYYNDLSQHNQQDNVVIDDVNKQNEAVDDIQWIPISETTNFTPNTNDYLRDHTPQIVEYDLLTKTESFKGINNNTTLQNISEVQPYLGLLESEYYHQKPPLTEGPQISYVFPPDDREVVTNTADYPWRTICKLFITADDYTKYIGSAAIIDDFHILTCGHCVYIHDHGGWVRELKVVPGKDDIYEPYGYAYATYFRSYTGWTQSEMEEHDWAVVTLDRSIGSFTGWMGRKTADPSSSIYTGILNTAGYPGDLNYGYYMYYASDYGEDADEYNHWYWIDSAGGQSGSPIWQSDGNNRYILTILAYGYEYGTYANFGTRLNQDKYDQINTWLTEDSSSPPDDKPDLLDGRIYSSINPNTIFPGKTEFNIYCDVKNEGTITASQFNVNFYASPDLSITTADYFIGSTSILSLAPFSYTTADWSGIFPSDIPKGRYYVGWIIDGTDTVNEFNENNNVVFMSNLQITVKSPSTTNLLIPIIITVPIVLVGVAVLIIIIKRKISRLPEFMLDELPEELNDF